jgi:hypothetical protein
MYEPLLLPFLAQVGRQLWLQPWRPSWLDMVCSRCCCGALRQLLPVMLMNWWCFAAGFDVVDVLVVFVLVCCS